MRTIPRVIRRSVPAYVVSRDCDCACAVSNPSELLKSTQSFALPNLVKKSPGIQVRQLSDENRLVFLSSRLGVSDSISVLNRPAWEILTHYQFPRSTALNLGDFSWHRSVFEATVMNLLELGFLMPFPPRKIQVVESPDVLPVWLHVTDRCNLRCDYCYLSHANTDMSLATGHAAIDATFRSALTHGYRVVRIKYAGGEPLLRFSLVVELHRYAQSLAQQHGITLDGVILSNGTLLTADTVKRMQAEGLRLMISLDGLKTYHDNQRHFPDGCGSFDSVVHAIDMALVGDLVPDISITVSGRNAVGLSDVVAWVLERELPFSLNFYRQNKCSISQHDLRLEEDLIIAGMLNAYKVIENNLPQRSLLASLADRANLSFPHLRACSAGKDYLAFDTQGRVAKCQMALTQSITDCYHQDPLSAIRNSEVGLRNLSVDDKSECQKCEWRYWCGGGCPLETYRVSGRYDMKSPNCNIYKALYPEIVRLEGLRLLKYADGDVDNNYHL